MIGAVSQLVILAFLVEALVQTLKPIWQSENRTPEFFISLGTGLILSVGLNVLAGLDIFSMVGIPLSYPLVGVVCTGILLSRGASPVHDLIKSIGLLKERLQE